MLVNEFGEMGLDGVVLKDAGVTARQIAGGCICCAAGPQLEPPSFSSSVRFAPTASSLNLRDLPNPAPFWTS